MCHKIFNNYLNTQQLQNFNVFINCTKINSFIFGNTNFQPENYVVSLNFEIRPVNKVLKTWGKLI